MLFELSGDCASCRVQGAVSETWDTEAAAYRLGLPVETRCRLCARTCHADPRDASAMPGEGCPSCGAAIDDDMRSAHRCAMCGAGALLVEQAPSKPIGSRDALEEALTTWAREEGHTTARELIESSFVAASVDEVFAALQRGEGVETTFDVAGFLFSASGFGGASGEPIERREDQAPDTLREPLRTSLPPSSRRIGGPREELLALASVAAADGDTAAGDLEALVRAAAKRNHPPLEPHDIRVWRANEVEPPRALLDRERVLEEMFQLAWADGQMDDSELRVIRDYARAWGIDPARVREWIELYSFNDSSAIGRWFSRIGLFLFPR